MDRASKTALWSKRVRAFERSGLRRRQWCDLHGVALATLDYWRSRLRTALPMSQSLVPIVVTDAPLLRSKSIGVKSTYCYSTARTPVPQDRVLRGLPPPFGARGQWPWRRWCSGQV